MGLDESQLDAAMPPRLADAGNPHPVLVVGAYLRSVGAVTAPARIEIEQGAHVGRPGLLTVDIPRAGGVVVSGHAVPME